jgi:fibro-slime domain-containing protein
MDSQGGAPTTTGGNSASGAATTGGSDGKAGNASTGGSGGDPGNGCGTTRTLPVTFRDFAPTHPDFLPVYIGELITGIVEPELDADQKPVLAGVSNAVANITSSETFAEWYTDGPNRATIPGEIVLFDDGAGGFVNRYGTNGERWQFWDELEVCQIAGSACSGCTVPAGSSCIDPCPESFVSGGTVSCTGVSVELDGNPHFFPIDAHPDALTDRQERAKIPEQYGGLGWPWEDDFLGGAQLHNFLFTTEIHVNFTYHADRSQRFDFLGDDDLWVFLNGQLIIDLGGWHVPLAGSFTIDDAIAQSYGLTDGEEYEISVFHAERQPEGSSFMIRLEGFEDCE